MNLRHLLGTALLMVGAVSASRPVDAAIVRSYELRGSAVQGLLHSSNEPGSITGGTGGEIGAGIQLDDLNDGNSNTFSLLFNGRVGWGSSQGFADLTSNVTNAHLHGPTAGINGGGGFTQTAGVLSNLTRSGNLPTGGTFTNDLAFTSAQVTQLNEGRFYINIHTATNGGGELRAFLVPTAVPEPSTLALLLGGACVAFAQRKRVLRRAAESV